MLDHTSGLPADAGGPALKWFQDLPIAQAARHVTGAKLASSPGTAWIYSNANYALLGVLIETVTGQPYADVLRTRILEPLGMHRTFTNLEDARAVERGELRTRISLLSEPGEVALITMVTGSCPCSTSSGTQGWRPEPCWCCAWCWRPYRTTAASPDRTRL